MPDQICLKTELLRLSELETISEYPRHRLREAAQAIDRLVTDLNDERGRGDDLRTALATAEQRAAREYAIGLNAAKMAVAEIESSELESITARKLAGKIQKRLNEMIAAGAGHDR